MRKLFKEKGIKQKLPYIFKSDDEQYSFNNAYMSSQTTISDIKNEIVFQANRSFFDFSKNKSTKNVEKSILLQLLAVTVVQNYF